MALAIENNTSYDTFTTEIDYDAFLRDLDARRTAILAAKAKQVAASTNDVVKKSLKKAFPKSHNTFAYTEKIIDSLFVKNDMYAALITTPQFGKTKIFIESVMLAIEKGHIEFNNFAIISGLSNNDWVRQTTGRIPAFILDELYKNNIKDVVFHRNTLVSKKGKELAKRINTAVIENKKFVIIIDEGHVASKGDQSMFRFFKSIYDTVVEGAGGSVGRDGVGAAAGPGTGGGSVTKDGIFEYFSQIGIKLLFVSATLDGVKISLETSMTHMGGVIAAKPWDVDSYVWMEDFVKAGIVRESVQYSIGDEVTKKGAKMLKEIVVHITSNTPGYSMFRPDSKSYDKIIYDLTQKIVEKGQEYETVYYDSEHNSELSCVTRGAGVDCACDSIEDLLQIKPTKHIIIVTKDMIRISQTTPTNYVRVMCDRPVRGSNPNVSTIIQSFAGRLCGHNRREHLKNILLFSSVKDINTYIELVKNDYDATLTPYTGYSQKKKGKDNNAHLIVSSTYVGESVVVDAGGDRDLVSRDVCTDNKLGRFRNTLQNCSGFVRRITEAYMRSSDINMCSYTDTVLEQRAIEELIGSKISNMGDYTSWKNHGRCKLLVKPTGCAGYKINHEVCGVIREVCVGQGMVQA